MINANVSVDWPWSTRWKILFYKSGLVSDHTAWEFNGYATHQIVELMFSFKRKCDHAGLHMMFGLFGYALEFTIYDTRHWDYDNECWETK